MKTFMFVTICLLLGCVAGFTYNTLNIETQVRRWKSHVESAEALSNLNSKILDAHMFSKEVMEAVRMLANENGILCERELKMTQYVANVEEENERLKNALKEAVITLEGQRVEINQLHDELSKAYFRLEVLEKALKLSPTEANPAKQEIQKVFDAVEAIDAILTIIPILL